MGLEADVRSEGSRRSIVSVPIRSSARVLVVSGDRRFLRLASFQLERTGAVVLTSTTLKGLADTVELHSPDVVVIDSGDSLSAAGLAVRDVESVLPEAVAVVVGDGRGRRALRLPLMLLPKWHSLDEIATLLTAVPGGSSQRRLDLGTVPSSLRGREASAGPS